MLNSCTSTVFGTTDLLAPHAPVGLIDRSQSSRAVRSSGWGQYTIPTTSAVPFSWLKLWAVVFWSGKRNEGTHSSHNFSTNKQETIKKDNFEENKDHEHFLIPVRDINVDNAGFQELPLLVSAGHQDPALVMWQAVPNKEHIIFGGQLCPYLSLFRLFVTGRAKDEGRRVELQWAWMLKEEKKKNE